MKMERPSKTNQCGNLESFLERSGLDCRYRRWGPRNLRSHLDDSSCSKGIGVPSRLLDWDMEENVFPLSRAAEDPDELEEERRSGSRAEKVLFLDQC